MDDPTKPLRTLIYVRVSDPRSGERSPVEQEAELRALAEQRGWVVTHVVSDVGIGASRFSSGERAGWAEAVRIIQSGAVDVLATWTSDRASRQMTGWVELVDALRETGTLWTSAGRMMDMARPDDVFVSGLDALLAERYAAELSRSTGRAIEANAAAGRPHGRVIYGYRRYRDEHGLPAQDPDPDEADVVQSIYRRFLAGEGARTIARSLTEAGTPGPSGGRWSDEAVRRVLRSPTYAALRVHRGEVVGEGAWPPIVDRATWDAAQDRRRATAARHPQREGTARLLTGVARCGVCGGRMTVGHDGHRGGEPRRVYTCRDGFCVARDADRLEKHVEDLVVERLSQPDVAEAVAAVDGPPVADTEAAALAGQQARLAEARTAYLAGDLPAATFFALEREVAAQAAATAPRRPARPVIDTPPDVGAWWAGLPRSQRRTLIGLLIEAVIVQPVGSGTRRWRPDAIELIWAS